MITMYTLYVHNARKCDYNIIYIMSYRCQRRQYTMHTLLHIISN